MKKNTASIQDREVKQLLFESAIGAVPFNIFLGGLLAIYLAYNGVPKQELIIWISLMIFVCLIRILHSLYVVKKHLYNSPSDIHIKIFIVVCFFTGITWSSVYFLSVPYTDTPHTYLILLVFGGMSAGATASLAACPPAFFAFILSVFLPVISYNYYVLEVDHAILASIFTLFVTGLSIVARSNKRLINRIFILTEQNKDLIEKLEKLSITDSLTGLLNRRHFLDVLKEEYNRAKRNGQSIVLISIDIDNFKLINDNLGHPAGDKFLKYVGNYLKFYLRRANDMVFRLGGDEFAVLILNTTKQKAMDTCIQITSSFKIDPQFEYNSHGANIKHILDQVTMSVGMVCVTHASHYNVETIIEKADQALYRAKNAGKNRIEISECL